MTGIPSQGEVIFLTEQNCHALVVSRDFFNQSGLCVVCPVVSRAAEDALHIAVDLDQYHGIVMCEQLKSLDLSKRHYRSIGMVSFSQIMDITDAVQAIFDYFPYG